MVSNHPRRSPVSKEYPGVVAISDWLVMDPTWQEMLKSWRKDKDRDYIMTWIRLDSKEIKEGWLPVRLLEGELEIGCWLWSVSRWFFDGESKLRVFMLELRRLCCGVLLRRKGAIYRGGFSHFGGCLRETYSRALESF
ncbi:hypothetical protein TIFTF001_029523 [Ficus carica]|uniref:Uncharacterized protein n=1 Tax=Ficus carica TaxID=3494 RepID=A0AA88DRS3_FICCA|nr:hypothetical protein TIFTF001_029523 [Ficus carica]